MGELGDDCVCNVWEGVNDERCEEGDEQDTAEVAVDIYVPGWCGGGGRTDGEK